MENRHHFNFIKREWERDSLARRIRNHPGMIIPLDVKVHNDLHANIPGLRPPIRSLSNLILQQLMMDSQPDPLINLANTSSFLLTIAQNNGRLGDDAFRVGSHYLDQVMFINENRIK